MNTTEHTPDPKERECQCKIQYLDEYLGEAKKGYIQFCPLHAAAPELLEVLEKLVRSLDKHNAEIPKSLCPWDFESSLPDARAAIASAKGENVTMKNLTLTIPDELLTRLQAIAQQERRSVSNLVTVILEKAIENPDMKESMDIRASIKAAQRRGTSGVKL